MLIRSLALCATLLATGCIAVPVGSGYDDGYYGSGYTPAYYGGTVVYRDYSPPRRHYYYRDRDHSHRYYRYDENRDRRSSDHGRGWD